ncbi:hypothetical protein HRbin36_02864 [bacterium HR36]|nr:hypothetical protein HRbin36_02864 [bacterium HR36]
MQRIICLLLTGLSLTAFAVLAQDKKAGKDRAKTFGQGRSCRAEVDVQAR